MLTHSELVQFLRKKSYVELTEIHRSGDFVVRGDTVSWWPVTELFPFRLSFFGEDLERIEVQEGDGWRIVKKIPELHPNEVETEHGAIHPEEYIVHPHHGVGIFERIETRETAEGLRQFVSLRYAGNDKLLFPLDRSHELMPYIGSRHPRLTRLYSKSWQSTKEKIQKDLIRIARELLRLYAARHLTSRKPFAKAPEFQEVLHKEAGFELTEDQARAWRDIQKDFAKKQPMDRLVCGDVGFGKTELAIRAAAQVLASGKQVALIAPTTVLAEQHYALFKKRFANLPVNVEHVSRLTASTTKQVLAQLAEGSVDLVIGTHRLLSKGVAFKDLGLLILDEEQKFGVQQKEWLKDQRPHLDVLSLSATPIPRTLSMSLSGLRSLSILRTPPAGRKSVEIEIHPYTDNILAKAIAKEVRRGGQAYVVHNRVQSIPLVVNRVCDLVKRQGGVPVLFSEGARASQKQAGEVVVAFAHGQMAEGPLAEVMSQFLIGEIDVLVASTIVEYGLDSPGANTLAVLHSERFGLSDLYQLRGRVGRRKEQAHAYFLLGGIERADYQMEEEEVRMTETAHRRLLALKEADELGSGWSVALRDLEIRGGGNILGHEQHGSMETIGLLLYAQLLQEEIGKQAQQLGIPLFQSEEDSTS